MVYVLDANNLGGYKEGAGQTDAVVATMNLASGVWGGCGSYPGEVCVLILRDSFVNIHVLYISTKAL